MVECKKRLRTFRARPTGNSASYEVHQIGDTYIWYYLEAGYIQAQGKRHAKYSEALNELLEDVNECWRNSLYYVPLRDRVASALRGARGRGI